MASSLKRPRPQESDVVAEDENNLVTLIHRRRGDVEKLVSHVKHLESELSEAQAKLDEARTLLDQMRGGSKIKYGDRDPNSGVRREAANGVNGVPSREEARVSSSSAKNGRVASPPMHSKKTAGGGLASRPVAPREMLKQPGSGQHPAGRGQDAKSSKRSSGVELKSNKSKGSVQREHVDLIAEIRSQTKRTKLDVALPSYIPLQRKRKPRSLVLSPAIDHLCATSAACYHARLCQVSEECYGVQGRVICDGLSINFYQPRAGIVLRDSSALDGTVNFWQITQEKGFGINLSHTVDCVSPVQGRWPEDLAWHPFGETLFAVYTADGGPQIGIIKTSKEKAGIKFLEDKPHEKGLINSIQFLPWSNGSQFVTGGCDHGVVLWTEKEEGWQPRLLHRVLHSSAVTGVGGIPSKNYIISSGMDKRVFAVDPSHGRSTFQHQLESKALGVLPNPADFNLVMVQTGTPGQQLRLFDIRVQRTELHCFGWNQQAGDSQSGYISQSWSPDGLYCASGSTDPKIHVFDIRYNSREPVQTLDAHQKRVFKAAWHPNLPVLLSISSDLFVGLHKIF